MKMMICGSMAFAKDMLATKKKLEALGHDSLVPPDIEEHIRDKRLVDNLEKNFAHATERDVMKRSFQLVAQSDAILVLNLKRKGIDGYIGTSALMEIGLAYYLGKKIFLFNPIPHYNDVRWAHEVTIMQPTIIHGDLNKIQ
ncbi:MAG: hypothetical protein HY431_00975 [Candidatus Levybacteria bacterium]|nr:hypothetical protein [Candidatus Levybacteria bacterium]